MSHTTCQVSYKRTKATSMLLLFLIFTMKQEEKGRFHYFGTPGCRLGDKRTKATSVTMSLLIVIMKQEDKGHFNDFLF